MMGLNVPDDMEGRVIEEIFDPPIEIGTEAAGVTAVSPSAADDAVFSAEDQELLTQRLRDLGYLE